MKNRKAIITEALKPIKGMAFITVRSAKDGRLLGIHVIPNLIVTAGKNDLADAMIGTVNLNYQYCAVGSGTNAPAVADTDLQTIIGARKAFNDRFRTNNKATLSFFFPSADNNGTWNEIGLFKALTGAPMFSRAAVSPAITKDTTKTVTVDWEITFG